MSVPYRLRQEAERFRRLADTADEQTAGYLLGLAADFEAEADQLDHGPDQASIPLPDAT